MPSEGRRLTLRARSLLRKNSVLPICSISLTQPLLPLSHHREGLPSQRPCTRAQRRRQAGPQPWASRHTQPPRSAGHLRLSAPEPRLGSSLSTLKRTARCTTLAVTAATLQTERFQASTFLIPQKRLLFSCRRRCVCVCVCVCVRVYVCLCVFVRARACGGRADLRLQCCTVLCAQIRDTHSLARWLSIANAQRHQVLCTR
jgi:hypothetical protein